MLRPPNDEKSQKLLRERIEPEKALTLTTGRIVPEKAQTHKVDALKQKKRTELASAPVLTVQNFFSPFPYRSDFDTTNSWQRTCLTY